MKATMANTNCRFYFMTGIMFLSQNDLICSKRDGFAICLYEFIGQQLIQSCLYTGNRFLENTGNHFFVCVVYPTTQKFPLTRF